MTRFWEEKSLAAMTTDEWESLCDGCGKCCVIKLEDVDTSVIHYTDIGCELLDSDTCRCSDYENRKTRVPDCVILTPQSLDQLPWMPETCAYRLLHEGKPLPLWHPLNTGDAQSAHKAGQSVKGLTIAEGSIAQADYPNHIKDWSSSIED